MHEGETGAHTCTLLLVRYNIHHAAIQLTLFKQSQHHNTSRFTILLDDHRRALHQHQERALRIRHASLMTKPFYQMPLSSQHSILPSYDIVLFGAFTSSWSRPAIRKELLRVARREPMTSATTESEASVRVRADRTLLLKRSREPHHPSWGPASSPSHYPGASTLRVCLSKVSAPASLKLRVQTEG